MRRSPWQGRTGRTVAIALCAIGVLVDRTSDADEKMVVVPFEDAKFVPLDPARPSGPAIAVLWGDPATGPSAMLMKFGKLSGQLHHHTSDYDLVVVKGTMKHWTRGEREADVRLLAAGSYWHQPGRQVHADSCASEECIMFIKWAGKRDAIAGQP